MSTPSHQTVAQHLDAIEAEMRRIGYWQAEPPPPEAFEFRQAFAMDTRAFVQWLQWVFVPRVREIVAEHGEFPHASQVGGQAVREFDGDHDAAALVTKLNEFDALFR